MPYNGEQQIADQVVYDGGVDNVEINEEVIRTYCEVIGIDYEKEKELLWIAEEGLKAPIPAPWKACRDTNSDELYYFNFQSGESQWDHPLDDFYSKKVTEEREKLRSKATSSRPKTATGRNLPDYSHQLTQPFPGPITSQSKQQHSLANTLPPDAKVNSPNFALSPVKEDGKRFLKSAKKSSDDELGGGGAREERLMFDLDEQIGSPQFGGANIRQEAPGYDDDYEEDVDFGDGDDRHLSEFLLEKESTMEPELVNLQSTGDHETGNSQFSQTGGREADIDIQTQNSGPMARPHNPFPEAGRIGASMTATSLDASEYLGNREPPELDKHLNKQFDNIKLVMLDDYESKVKELESEMAQKFLKEEARLKKENNDQLEKLKQSLQQELNAAIDKETATKNEKMKTIETNKVKFEEETRQRIEELRSNALNVVESERRLLENREDEVSKRLAAAKADIDGEVGRRLAAEKAMLEVKFAEEVSILRKEISAQHESELAQLRLELEEVNNRELDAKKAEIRAAEQRASSVRVLESEMSISLDRRKAELHDEHENTLAKIRRDLERAVLVAKQDADSEIAKVKSESVASVEEAKLKISEETDRLIAEAKSDGERARSIALSRVAGLEDSVKAREERAAKRQKDLDELERKLSERERQLKSRQDELKAQQEEISKEESNIANQKASLEKKRAEISGIQRSIAVDEMIKHHANRTNRKSGYRNDDDGHSTKSAESTSKGSISKSKKHRKKHKPRQSSSSEQESTESSSEEEDATTVDQTSTTAPSKRAKDKLPKLADLLPPLSTESETDEGNLGHNGKKVRKLLLDLLFPQKTSLNHGDESLGQTSSHHTKTRKTSKTASVFNVNISDDSDIDLTEIRSRLRAERLRSLQMEQKNYLQGSGSEKSTLQERAPVLSSSIQDHRSSYLLYGHRPVGPDMDRYLAARWYQLYRGSAYSAPLRSASSSWQWPLASSSTKYGYVPARDLLTQYSASKLAAKY